MSQIENHVTITNAENRITIVEFLEKELMDGVTTNAVQSELIGLIETTSPIKLLLDFSRVDFIGSRTLAMLIITATRIKITEGQLCFTGVNRSIREVIEIAKLEKLFAIYPTREEACLLPPTIGSRSGKMSFPDPVKVLRVGNHLIGTQLAAHQEVGLWWVAGGGNRITSVGNGIVPFLTYVCIGRQ